MSNWTLIRCRSHEKNSTPMAWEHVFTGTKQEVKDHFSAIPYVQRIDDRYAVTDESDTAYADLIGAEDFVRHA